MTGGRCRPGAEHIVDTVLYFEATLRASARARDQNRYGVATIGVFAMTERGLKGVANRPRCSCRSMRSRRGFRIVATLEGSRPLLVEIQALADPVQGGMPSACSGLDPQRLALPRGAASPWWHRDERRRFRERGRRRRINEPAAISRSRAVHSCTMGRPPPRTLIFGEVAWQARFGRAAVRTGWGGSEAGLPPILIPISPSQNNLLIILNS